MAQQSYFTDDVALSVPEGFRDRTTHVLEWTTPSGPIALSVTREVLARRPLDAPPSTDDLEQYFEATTRARATEFAGFRVERDERATTATGLPFHRQAFRWKRGAEALYRHDAFTLVGDRIVVMSATAAASLRDKVDVLIDRALENLRRRRGT